MANTADHTVGSQNSGSQEVVAHQTHFIKVFIGVLVSLTVFTLFCILVARMLAGSPDDSSDPMLRAQLLERIGPAGSVITNADQLDQPAVAVAATDTAPKSGEEIVASNCAACHVAGVAGAPKSDDSAEWAKRREAGLDAMVASVINGKGNMPARAGTTLSDEELLAAVQLLAGFTPEEDSAAAPAASEAPATEPAVETAGTLSGLTDSIKQVTDSVCAACHISGVGGAPKLGDKEAWAERAEKGLEGMVAVVAAGKGAMPARGGSPLTDDEIAVAIQYLMSK